MQDNNYYYYFHIDEGNDWYVNNCLDSHSSQLTTVYTVHCTVNTYTNPSPILALSFPVYTCTIISL